MDNVAGLFAAAAGFGFAAWVVIILALVAIMVGVEQERYRISFIALVASTIALLYLFGSGIGEAFRYLTSHPRQIVNVLLIYAGIGVAYGFVKWFFYLFRIRDRLVAFRKNYDIKGKLTDKQRADFWDQNRRELRAQYGETLPPRASGNKSRITFWMIWWPFSLPWTILNEPVKRFFDFVYHRIAGVLQRMSNRIFRDLA